MRLRVVRITVAVTIIALAMLTQLVPSIGPGSEEGESRSSPSAFGVQPRVLAQDDNDEDDNNDEDDDNDEDNEDGDNDDEDNEDDNEDSDNEDEDNDADNDDADDDNDDGDNEDDELDNIEADNDGDDESDEGASFGFDALVTEASGRSTGGDSRIGLPADRVLVQLFPWMPAGINLMVRLVDPSTLPTPPCAVVGDLLFEIVAHDDAGAELGQLPAEVNLSARYTNQQLSGLNRQDVTLAWLDAAAGQWRTAPKLVTSPATNYVAASVTALGAYAVCAS